eukprot:gene29060-9512_t
MPSATVPDDVARKKAPGGEWCRRTEWGRRGLTQEQWGRRGLTQEQWGRRGLTQEQWGRRGLTQEQWGRRGLTQEQWDGAEREPAGRLAHLPFLGELTRWDGDDHRERFDLAAARGEVAEAARRWDSAAQLRALDPRRTLT